MYGSPMAEHNQKTNAAARTAIRMPNKCLPPFGDKSFPLLGDR
jgi:hypothetical protein